MKRIILCLIGMVVMFFQLPAEARPCIPVFECKASSWECTKDIKEFKTRQAFVDWLNTASYTNYEVVYSTSKTILISFSVCTPVGIKCTDGSGECTREEVTEP